MRNKEMYNTSGCADPTAYYALKRVQHDERMKARRGGVMRCHVNVGRKIHSFHGVQTTGHIHNEVGLCNHGGR